MIYREIPGKLFLMGEYAVMSPGHPALIFAVDRCLRARISEHEKVRLEIPSWDLDMDEHALVGEPPVEPRANFVRNLLNAMYARLGENPGFHLVIEPHPRDLAARDLGLGTSSALSVALAQSLLISEPRDSLRVLALALGAHHDVQGGKGSGADVATAWAGRSIRFERTPNGLPKYSALPAPRRFHFAAAFSGSSQRTAAAVQAFEKVEAIQPYGIARFRKGTCDIVDQTARGWEKGGARIVRNVERAGKLMGELAKLLNAEAPVPEFLLAAARAGGGVIKASGGIGGDCFCIVAEHENSLHRLQKMAEGAGYELLDLQPIFGGR